MTVVVGSPLKWGTSMQLLQGITSVKTAVEIFCNNQSSPIAGLFAFLAADVVVNVTLSFSW